jgi:error-prone DNA polymerase
MKYTELQVTTNFSFLRGASHPDEMVQQAVALGYTSLAITDCNTVAGVVRAHAAAKKQGLKLIPGCRLHLLDGPGLLAFPAILQGWKNLCALLTTGNRRAEKGDCHLYKADVYQHATGLIFIALPPEKLDENFAFEPSFEVALKEYKEMFGHQLSRGYFTPV